MWESSGHFTIPPDHGSEAVQLCYRSHDSMSKLNLFYTLSYYIGHIFLMFTKQVLNQMLYLLYSM